MQQHNRSRNSALQKLDHSLEVESFGLGIKVRILDPLQACMFDDVLVVEPGRVGDVNPSGEVLAEESETQTQGTSA